MAIDYREISDILPRTTVHIPVGVLAAASAQGSDWDTRNEPVIEFGGTVTVPAATVLGTGTLLTLLLAAGPNSGAVSRRCPKGYKLVIEDILVTFSATGWTGGVDLRISDSTFLNDFLIIATAGATAGASYRAPFNGTIVNVTQSTSLLNRSGATFENGLIIRTNGTFTAGTAFTVGIRGYATKV